jgi:hypothetical protein
VSCKYPLKPAMPEALKHLPTQYRRNQYEAAKTNYEKAKKRERLAMNMEKYVVNGEEIGRDEMMCHIVMMTAEGMALPQILKTPIAEGDVFPTPSEVKMWLRLHPGFKTDLEEAESWRAEVLASSALDKVMELDELREEGTLDKDAISKAKLQNEALLKQAEFLSSKFQAKSLKQIEDVTEKLDEKGLRDRLNNLLSNNPGLRQMIEAYTSVKKVGELSDCGDADAEIV